MKLERVGLAATLGALLIGSTYVEAAQQPDYLAGHPHFETATGSAPRAYRAVNYDIVPRAAKAAWQKFAIAAGGEWRSMWDAHTGVPLRIYGSGIAVPGSVDDPIVAEAASRTLLAEHIGLLAPGASFDDFQIVSNEVTNGIRSVGFIQYHNGMRVIGGQLGFRFKKDRMLMINSEALPTISSRDDTVSVTDSAATTRAIGYIQGDFGADDARASTVDGPYILPLVRADVAEAIVEYPTVLTVRVDSTQPIGRWDVYIDALTGEPVARRQLLHFANGTVQMDVALRRPGGDRQDAPAHYVRVDANGEGNSDADIDGNISWSGNATASVDVQVRGTYTNVNNDAGSDEVNTISLDPDGTFVWTATGEYDDAQLVSYVYANNAKLYARGLNPDLGWLDRVQEVNVNINDTCNAFSDLDAINFFRQSQQCNNTGRLADVVYHEFGHSLHGQSVIEGVGEFDSGMSEGLSDYYAATIQNDSGMGRGFFLSDEPLREMDPPNSEAVWPDDAGEAHDTGLIIGGTLWDLRKAMIEAYGYDEGVERTDDIFYAIIQRAGEHPTAYAEALLADDDDGDLANGTPNQCLIHAAFELHGMADGDAASAVGIQKPTRDGFTVNMKVTPPQTVCEVANIVSANVEWSVRGSAEGGSIVMDVDGEDYQAVIPAQDEGQVLNYRVMVELDDGRMINYPKNPADPFYQVFLGDVEIIYCTDFETDPAEDGWTHGLTSGEMSEGADDWQWGAPNGDNNASGDPGAAFSGNFVYGNDLGEDNFNGEYQNEKVNFALSPEIDVTGYDNVRLQYRRWLGVEDAQFDQANVYANDSLLWTNLDTTDGDTHHTEFEWRFHDIELTDQVADNKVQVKYEIASDQGLSFGGWTLDDFCIVAFVPSVCGDGVVSGVEECDDGDDNSDDGADTCRTSCLLPMCGDGVTDDGEQCDDGNDVDDDLCSNTCIGEGPDEVGGCCSTGEGDVGGMAALFGLTLFGLAILRRRRKLTE